MNLLNSHISEDDHHRAALQLSTEAEAVRGQSLLAESLETDLSPAGDQTSPVPVAN